MEYKKIKLKNLLAENQIRYCESDEDTPKKYPQNYRVDHPRCQTGSQRIELSETKLYQIHEWYTEKKSWKPIPNTKRLEKIEKEMISARGLIKMNSLEDISSEGIMKEGSLKAIFKTAFSKVIFSRYVKACFCHRHVRYNIR
jgi:hypothetical protein